MAQDYAKKFYNSTQWKKARKYFIQSVDYLCQRCKDGTLGYIVHHKIHLTPENINDHKISLAYENLEYLCLRCHNKEHNESEPIIADGLEFDANGMVRKRWTLDDRA